MNNPLTTSDSVRGRRGFLAATGGTLFGLSGLSSYLSDLAAAESEKPRWINERIGFGGIGLRYQGSVDLHTANQFGEVVAVCDVDKNVRDQSKASFGSRPASYERYQDLLKNKNVDAVIIGTPDHWHVQIAADALRAGKHVYVEKPLTLTIQEGLFLREVVRETGKVLQVGSWQRSDSRFRLAVELVRAGRIGKLKKVEVVLGKNKVGGPFEIRKTPSHLNWDLWQGQTPRRPYIEERCHYTFRWWLEYSGGQMTDWGCHHVDIANWAIDSVPVSIAGKSKWPTANDRSYNVPIDFWVSCRFKNDVEMTVADQGRNGVLFHGENGRLFVNRGTIAGKPVEQLKSNPFSRNDFKLYEFDNRRRPERAGKLESIINHMGNFVDCIAENKSPISDFESQHRSTTICHLGNIALRTNKKIEWDADREAIVGNAQANAMLKRERRKGFELT